MRLLVFFCCTFLASAVDVVVLGDSWAAESETYVADNCAGRTVLNRGVAHSTAKDWAAGSCPVIGFCSPADAFKAAPGVKAAWFSIGGNDFLGSGCMMAQGELSAIIGSALKKVTEAAPPGLRILMTGYCTPPAMAASMIPSCNRAALIGNLNGAIKDACEAGTSCTFVDAVGACGGSRSSFSKLSYFSNSFHVNQLGYQAILQMPGVQTTLGCGPTPALRKYKLPQDDSLSKAGAVSAQPWMFAMLASGALATMVGGFAIHRHYAVNRHSEAASIRGIECYAESLE